MFIMLLFECYIFVILLLDVLLISDIRLFIVVSVVLLLFIVNVDWILFILLFMVVFNSVVILLWLLFMIVFKEVILLLIIEFDGWLFNKIIKFENCFVLLCVWKLFDDVNVVMFLNLLLLWDVNKCYGMVGV